MPPITTAKNMMNLPKHALPLLSAVFILSLSPSISFGFEWHGVFNLGHDFGGDRVASLKFAGGGTAKLKTDEGFYLDIGCLVPFNQSFGRSYEWLTTVGVKVGEETASNGALEWKSIPVRTTLLARLGNYRLGGGLVYHTRSKFEATGAAGAYEIDFDDALGYELQIAYAPYHFTYSASGYQLGIRHTITDFETTIEDRSLSLDGSTTAVFIGYVF